MKKIIALILAAILTASMGATAFAADTTIKDQLTDITLIVKDTLNIGDEYTEFNGSSSESNSLVLWDLYWSSSTGSVYVTADNEGKVISYDKNSNDYYRYYSSDYDPAFPSMTKDEAAKIANEFFGRVLSDNETAELEAYDNMSTSNNNDYYLYGTLKMNGLPTDNSVYLNIDAQSKEVTSFSRSDGYDNYSNEYPSTETKITAADAQKLLNEKLELELSYILSDDGKTAALRYIPVYSGDYAVDAKTGKVLDVEQSSVLYAKMYAGGMGASTASSSMSLSDAEQSGIEKLDGVLSKDELDAKIRAVSELGIDDSYEINSTYYSTYGDTITCDLNYIDQLDTEAYAETYGLSVEKMNLMIAAGDLPSIYKSVTVNAKTGELISLYTSYPYGEVEDAAAADTAALQKKAESFLTKYHSEHFALTELADTTDNTADKSYYSYNPSVTYTYTRKVNGYKFSSDSFYVSVNSETGYIDSFSSSWTDDVSFDSAEGIIPASEAMESYAAVFETKLSYINIPGETDENYDTTYEIALAYSLYYDGYCSGIDAKTGKAILVDYTQSSAGLEYNDLESSYAKEKIEKMAEYGIGFSGDSYKPKAELTQKDMLELLLSAVGYTTGSDEDSLYSAAYSYNIITEAEKAPDSLITRAQLAKIIVTISGYGKSADFKGIYVCGFSDDKAIASADYGYIAIAKGMGLINGDESGNFNPNKTITREQAAIMLYNFLSRQV